MVKYELVYFQGGGRASPIRDILNFVGADWTETNPEWPSHKSETPFGYLPYLNITEDNGETWQLAEAIVIELYLAKKFNLVPFDDLKESSLQLQVYHQITELWALGGAGYVFFPEGKESFLANFNRLIEPLVVNHKKALVKNGNNGHYHGDKISLTDLVLFSWISFYHANGLADQINEKDTPEIYKVYLQVKNHPKVKPFNYTALTEGIDEN
ncbi:hypothetical protein BJ944DRAFT_236140 [Cunninghamella echinulata]|nr:hypothetical protein BJ944DRAFT_236140 [Cunninghamella echinulata]